MRAAFSPPPLQRTELGSRAAETGQKQRILAENQPDLRKEETDVGNPMFTSMEHSPLENSAGSGQSAPQPLLKTGGSSAGDPPKNPINPSLLEPLDSIQAEMVSEIQEYQRPAGTRDDHGFELPEPPTPAQVRQRRLETAPSSLGPEEKRKRRSKGRSTPSGTGRRRSLDRSAGGSSLDDESQRQTSRAAKSALLRSGGSGSMKMQGQDTLEVRSVTLANGQKASLILEEGRLQRIVAANGQVAELKWRPPTLNRVARPQRQLSVKLYRGISPPRNADAQASHAMPTTIRRWANSLNSQRLTTGPSATFQKQSLNTAPGEFGGLNSKDMRTIKSLDIGSSRRDTTKRRGFMQSLFSLPMGPGTKSVSQGDMPSILETSREVRGDWNPIHESWLPSAMTTQFLGGTPPLSGEPAKSNLQSGTQSKPRALISGGSVGRSLEDRKKMTQSVDAALGAPAPALVQPEDNQRPASIAGGEAFRMNAALYDSDPGPIVGHKKGGFWKVLKRILHLPSITKPRSPRAAPLGPSSPRRSFFGIRGSKRFSLGSGRRSESVAQAAKSLPEHNSPEESQRYQSMSALPDVSDSFTAATRSSQGALRPKSHSTQILKNYQGGQQANNVPRSQRPESSLPATPQRRETVKKSLEASPPTPEPAGRAQKASVLRGTEPAPEAARSLHSRMEHAGELIDTAKLRAALTNHKPGQEALLSQISSVGGDDKSARPRRRRTTETEKPLSGKQRTKMAGKWQKNFTEGTSGAKVDELLQVSSLQRLARERIVEMEIVETEETFELVWHIPLNGSASKISKTDRYLKNGEVVEAARRDGRAGVLRSQLTFTPEGHVHIRALQGEPFSAVFHDRIKLSTGGRRIKIEQKFQLLQPGVLPVKHYTIWNRVE